MKPIFIIGLPGCGKTTLGRALAKSMGREFIDLDLYIENRFHQSVRDIFAAEGECGFRKKESAMLREVGEMEDVIVACGGGTPCHAGNMNFMKAHGSTIWLEASEDVLHSRLCRARSRRPHFAGLSDDQVLVHLRELDNERRDAYSQAELRFCGNELENARLIAGSVDRFMNMFPYI